MAVNINSRGVHIRLKGVPLSNIGLSGSLSPYIVLLCLDFSTLWLKLVTDFYMHNAYDG